MSVGRTVHLLLLRDELLLHGPEALLRYDDIRYELLLQDEEHGKTSKEGVYAGGDAVTGAATVILAMGAGKAGARGIDEYLSNK